ncbi:hypothetical protein THAOC_33247, partial [Thalassiosira oceanica]
TLGFAHFFTRHIRGATPTWECHKEVSNLWGRSVRNQLWEQPSFLPTEKKLHDHPHRSGLCCERTFTLSSASTATKATSSKVGNIFESRLIVIDEFIPAAASSDL